MKAEERHELQDNDLAGWLQFGLWNFIKQNGSYVLLVIALGFLGFQLWNLYQTKQNQKRIAAWMDYRAATDSEDPGKLLDVISKYDLKPVQAQAYLALSDHYQRIIVDQGYLESKKLTRSESLDKALGYYKNAIETLGEDPLIAGKAHLGMASTYEDMGEWDKAKSEYQILTDKAGKFSGSPFAGLAAARLATLDDRRNAPRLVSMIPPPPPIKPDTGLPSSLGVGGGALPTIPGILSPAVAPTTQSFGPIGPALPTLPNLTPAPVIPLMPPGGGATTEPK